MQRHHHAVVGLGLSLGLQSQPKVRSMIQADEKNATPFLWLRELVATVKLVDTKETELEDKQSEVNELWKQLEPYETKWFAPAILIRNNEDQWHANKLRQRYANAKNEKQDLEMGRSNFVAYHGLQRYATAETIARILSFTGAFSWIDPKLRLEELETDNKTDDNIIHVC